MVRILAPVVGKWAVTKHFGSIKTTENLEKKNRQVAIMEDGFPVRDEIHCYLILGNVLLARAKLLAAGFITNLNGQTPACSGKLSESQSMSRKTFL